MKNLNEIQQLKLYPNKVWINVCYANANTVSSKVKKAYFKTFNYNNDHILFIIHLARLLSSKIYFHFYNLTKFIFYIKITILRLN